MKKTVFASGEGAELGMMFSEQPFVCTSSEVIKEEVFLKLSDRSGHVKAVLSKETILEPSFVGSVVLISGTIWKDNGEILLKVKTLQKAKKDEYRMMELYPGILPERKQEYLNEISDMVQLVNHKGYRALLEVVFAEPYLSTFCLLPATLKAHGNFQGGLLTATAAITRMALETAKAYVINGNQLYPTEIDWSRLITAGLLHGCGNFAFVTRTFPFTKTPMGMLQGYASTLQSVLLELVHTHQIPMEQKDLAILFNVMATADIYRSPVKNATKEGIILGQAFSLYSDLDAFDHVCSEYVRQDKEEIFYSSTLKSYVALDAIKAEKEDGKEDTDADRK